MSNAIEAIGLHKTFVKTRSIREVITDPLGKPEVIRALRGVDLTVRTGEILSLLGPNGAGKTTLLKIFSCLVLPDQGRALVSGTETIHEDRVKREIGLVHSDERSFYWRLSGRENLRFFARLYDVPRSETESRISELLDQVQMTEAADRPFSGYSSGMKQRMAIVRSLLHDPPILLMDEPTRSLDPASSMSLRNLVRERLAADAGKTILLATHDLREAEDLSDRVAILARGRVRQVGTVDEVRRWGMSERQFRLELEPGSATPAGRCRVLSDETQDGARHLLIAVEEGVGLSELLRAWIAAGVLLRACDRVEPDLEQAFSRILAEQEAEQAAEQAAAQAGADR